MHNPISASASLTISQMINSVEETGSPIEPKLPKICRIWCEDWCWSAGEWFKLDVMPCTWMEAILEPNFCQCPFDLTKISWFTLRSHVPCTLKKRKMHPATRARQHGEAKVSSMKKVLVLFTTLQIYWKTTSFCVLLGAMFFRGRNVQGWRIP